MCKLSDTVKGIFRRGNPSGDLPSPRVEVEEIWYDEEWQRVIVDDVLPPVSITTVQNTNSMEPLIDIGHKIVWSGNPLYLDNLNEGDFVIRKDNTCHTIIQIEGDYCWTQGENSTEPDPTPATREDIKWIGIMVIWCKDGIEGD